jgi:hypothetical protein
MNISKYFTVICTLVLCSVLTGCSIFNKQELHETTHVLTIDDVKTVFAQADLHLETWKDRTYYKLGHVSPEMFKINDGKYAIYVFKTEEDRKKGRLDFDEQTAMAKLAFSHIFEIKNILIFELAKPSGSGFKVNEILADLNKSPVMLGSMDVTTVLKRQGIELQRTGIIIPYFKIDEGNEEGFKINNKEQLYVYVFDSKEKVDEGLKQIETETATRDFAFSPIPYKVHNILMIYLRYPPIQGVEENIHTAIYGKRAKAEMTGAGNIQKMVNGIPIDDETSGYAKPYAWIPQNLIRYTKPIS